MIMKGAVINEPVPQTNSYIPIASVVAKFTIMPESMNYLDDYDIESDFLKIKDWSTINTLKAVALI